MSLCVLRTLHHWRMYIHNPSSCIPGCRRFQSPLQNVAIVRSLAVSLTNFSLSLLQQLSGILLCLPLLFYSIYPASHTYLFLFPILTRCPDHINFLSSRDFFIDCNGNSILISSFLLISILLAPCSLLGYLISADCSFFCRYPVFSSIQ